MVQTNSILAPSDIAHYPERPENAGPLYDVTHLNKYAWWLEDKGRRETPKETWLRVTNYNLSLYQGPASPEELKKEALLTFHKGYELETEPAGRTLRIGGTPACYKFPEMNFNCAYITIDTLEAIVESFHMSLCSVGLGYRNLYRDVAKIDKFCTEIQIDHIEYKHDLTRREYTSNHFQGYQGKFPVYELVIGDSKEGWVEALRTFLVMTHAHSFDSDAIKWVINYNFIRPSGQRIKTAGGFAAGHKGMQEMFSRLVKTINSKKGRLTTVSTMDSQNIVGKNVVTGGNRRSAQIALGSPDDYEFITAKQNLYTKVGDKWIVDPELEHRKMSNNSVVFEEKPSREKLHEIFQVIKSNGEPGFFNLEAARKRRPNCEGLNPCKSLKSLILTDRGYVTFEQALQMDSLSVVLADGSKAKASKPFKTGTGRQVHRFLLSNGAYIYATGNHLHKTAKGEWLAADKLTVGQELAYGIPKVFSFETPVLNQEEYESGVLAGWIHGDGSLAKRKDCKGYTTQLCFGDHEFDVVPFFEGIFGKKAILHHQKPKTCKVLASHKVELAEGLIRKGMSLDKENLTWLYQQHRDFKVGFIKALFTADGSVRKNNLVELYSTRRPALEAVANVLREFGIFCNITIHAYPKRYISKDRKWRNNSTTYKITIFGGQFKSIGFLSKRKQDLLDKQKWKEPYRPYKLVIKGIDWNFSQEDVYDITVDHPEHYFIDASSIAHNCAEILLDSRGVCNLSTVVMTTHLVKRGEHYYFDEKKLEESCRLAVRIGMRQTNVTLSIPSWDKVQKRDRLIGPSYTGWEDAIDMAPQYKGAGEERLLTLMGEWANDEADKYAYEMRIPRPLLVNTVKPEGTISQLPTCSSGLHRAFAPYYIRRMSITKNDPLNQALKELGVPWEVDMREKESTREIFLFPVKTNAKICAYDEPVKDQLERYYRNQRLRTDHNSSCTIYVGAGYDGFEDEWDEAEQIVWDNWEDTIAVSFLPKHSLESPPFPQMPYEWTSKENYDNMMETFPDLSQLGAVVSKYEKERTEFYEYSDGCEGGVCPTA